MRLSIPICIASSLAVMLITWWLGTRSKDFLTPPSKQKLEKIRINAAQTNPTAQGLGDALSPSTDDRKQSPIPVVLPEHVNLAPQLDDYREEAKLGADYLHELARQLANTGHPDRAITCWERIIDSTKADDGQIRRACREISKTKAALPPWNAQPEDGIPIVIQIGTGPKGAALVEPLLKQLAQDLQTLSMQVISVDVKISSGTDDLIDSGKTPAALWITGPADQSTSTDIVSFSIPVENPEDLDQQLKALIYRIIRHHLEKHSPYNRPPSPDQNTSPESLLESHVTRLSWKIFAESLQTGS